MTGLPRRAAALLCTTAVATVAACSSSPRAVVPEEFCEVPMPKASLAPLIPDHGPVRQTYDAYKGWGGAGCTLTAGGKQIIFVVIAHWNHAPAPESWQDYDERYAYAVKRPVDFPGRAVVGSDHALVQATCTSSSYLSLDISFSGERVENSSIGYEKLLRFVNSLVPQVTEKFCTS